jgi:hypothetical protein
VRGELPPGGARASAHAGGIRFADNSSDAFDSPEPWGTIDAGVTRARVARTL